MEADDFDREMEEKFPDALGGLNQIAERLDTRQYPRQAWTGARRLRGGVIWKIAGAAIGIAAAVAIAVHLWPANGPAPKREVVIVKTPPPQSPIPRIVIIEDLDSYSVVDLNNDVPVVSFATKNSTRFETIMPMFPASVSQPAATRNSHL